MVNWIRICFTFGLIGLFSTHVYAQEKFEKESRMKEQDVPSKALHFIDSLKIESKVKWYLEEGLERNSIEAKFKWHKEKYSVEFDTFGVIEDVEIEIKEKKVPEKSMESMQSQLQKNCVKHKVSKIQIQYGGSHSALLKQLDSDELIAGVSVNYELIVQCKSTDSTDLFEYVFNDAGELVSTARIIFKNSSHLEY